MEADPQNLKFQLIIPTIHPPPALAHLTKPNAQLLLGYRNMLIPSENGWNWGLIKNSEFCGRAFLFQISQQEAHNIQGIKQADEILEIVGNNYILLKNEKEIPKSTNQISPEQLRDLLEKIGGVSKINLNILKSSFNSLSQYKKTAEKAASELTIDEKKSTVSVGDQVKLQFNTKGLAGTSLFDLPVISKQTGNIVEGEKLTIKTGQN